MNETKKQILLHFKDFVDRVEDLKYLSEEQWRSPIDKGQWSIAEVIGHLIPWDEFVLRQRIPYLFKETQLPKGPDTEQINNQASVDSKRRTKEETIEVFIEGRKNLINAIDNLEEDLWTQDFIIGEVELTLFSYFFSIAEHDEHHFGQIQRVLRLV
ncbi:DinB family protein [Lysinibacillus sp. NPDC097287]|uniref:DinB family protein n=1 Tax=Lysinibacillus sp. NPDC097287 TaxID=3364144 RepID=UPI0037FC0EDE